MADGNHGSSRQERYESLHEVQSSPTAATATTASNRYGAVSNDGNHHATPAGNGTSTTTSKAPERPGKLAKMVRMASQILVHGGRSVSSNSITTTQKRTNYGSMDGDHQHQRNGNGNGVPRLQRDGHEDGVFDDDDDDDCDPWQEEPWGQWRLMLLTLGLAGAQLTWTVELGYGTPYLLSLGLSKELTSLVWLAGPISGFVVQPLIGAMSDNSSSKYRRRRWVVYTSTLIVVSTLILAFASELATALVDLFNSGAGDWDPKRREDIRLFRIILAVFAFYVLDFSLNGLQASLRALVLDLVPSFQQTDANAYLARMTNIGNIIGYGVGYINLSASPALRWLGGGQFRKLCIVAIFCLVVAVTITCATNHEERLPKIKRNKSLKHVFGNIWGTLRDLPIPIRRICYVQLFAWSGFFPMMFYSTTWVAARYKLQFPDHPPSDDAATRQGSLSLLAQSIVAVLASIILPLFQALGTSGFILSKPPGKFWNLTRWSLTWFTPRNIWTASHVWFVAIIATTFAAKSVASASAVVALLGVSWAVTCWVPFGILMEFILELEAGAELNADEVISASEVILRYEESEAGNEGENASGLTVPGAGSGRRRQSGSRSPNSGRRRSNASSHRSRRSSVRSNRSNRSTGSKGAAGRFRAQKALTECRPLLGDGEQDEESNMPPMDPPEKIGGTILGIHNLAIVSPQFITAIVAAIIFKITEVASKHHAASGKSSGLESGEDVVWVLRFGALMTLLAVFASRWVPPPPSEVQYIEALKEASNVVDSDDEDA